jgi:hypothetical protein
MYNYLFPVTTDSKKMPSLSSTDIVKEVVKEEEAPEKTIIDLFNENKNKTLQIDIETEIIPHTRWIYHDKILTIHYNKLQKEICSIDCYKHYGALFL